MNYVHGKRRRRVIVQSTPPPGTGGGGSGGVVPHILVARRPVRPRGVPPRALLLNSPPKLNPPFAGTYMPRPLIVRRLTRTPIGRQRMSVIVLGSPPPPPTPPIPPQHVANFKPLIVQRLARTLPGLPVKANIVRAKLPIPGPTKAIVVKRYVPKGVLPSWRVSCATRDYPPINSAAKAVIVQRFDRPKTWADRRWITVRSPVEHRPLATLPTPLVLRLPSGPARGAARILRPGQQTAKPIVARTTSTIIKQPRRLILPPSVFRPATKTIQSAAQVAPSILVVKRPVRTRGTKIIRPLISGGQTSPQGGGTALPQTVTCRIISSLELRQITIVSANGCVIQQRPPIPFVLDPRSRMKWRPGERILFDKAIIKSTPSPTPGPPDPPGEQPPDLIAAVIAMLKRQPPVVAALDEDP